MIVSSPVVLLKLKVQSSPQLPELAAKAFVDNSKDIDKAIEIVNKLKDQVKEYVSARDEVK